MVDVERRGLTPNVMFLAGSAINSIKNARGDYDPAVGAEAMAQALAVHTSGTLRDVPLDDHARRACLARRRAWGGGLVRGSPGRLIAGGGVCGHGVLPGAGSW